MNYTDNKAKETVTVKLADFYGRNCLSNEYAEVSREVYEFLTAQKKKERRDREKDARHIRAFIFDDGDFCSIFNIGTESAETEYSQKAKFDCLKEAFAALSEKHKIRLYKHFVLGLTYVEKGKLEDLTAAAIRSSVLTALKRLRKAFDENKLF